MSALDTAVFRPPDSPGRLPLTGSARSCRLYGRGTCDTNGFVGSMLALLPEMLDGKLPQPVHSRCRMTRKSAAAVHRTWLPI
ncbi:acetylornithine deacetylase [Paraburkholderia xenovorans LB400]|nr:acetylornithine deacetylase [Paraburkholderia xenovorans LB400]